jgi:hypothetical protein
MWMADRVNPMKRGSATVPGQVLVTRKDVK